MTHTTAPIVVIGTGLAGYNLVKELRKLDTTTPVMMITADDGRNYSKPMLSTGFSKGQSAEQLALASAADMAAQLNVIIRTNTRVTHIDADHHQVMIGEECLAYSKLVLACGAEPIAAPLQGDAQDLVFSINDLEDYQAFRAALEGKRRVLILGAGLIGCEYANDLRAGGYEVDVVAPSSSLLPTLLPEVAGNALRNGLEALGVRFHLNTLVQTLQYIDGGVRATLSHGHEIEADVVVSAIGLRPRIAQAAEAGLQVNQGIVVDRLLQTSKPDVYALGDCAEVDGMVLLYVLPLMTSARALAKTLSGTPTPVSYGVMPITVKTPALPVVVNPPRHSVGEWHFDCDGDHIQAEFRDLDGKLQGYALTGTKVMNKVALNKELPALLP